MARKINNINGKISFINDDPSAPSPNLPVTDKLATLIESAVRSTEFTININSSTGGKHSTRSFHYHGMAIDINLLGGKRIDDKSNSANVQKFQNIIAANPNTAECFGPFINIRKRGSKVEQKPQVLKAHLNHLHISSQG